MRVRYGSESGFVVLVGCQGILEGSLSRRLSILASLVLIIWCVSMILSTPSDGIHTPHVWIEELVIGGLGSGVANLKLGNGCGSMLD